MERNYLRVGYLAGLLRDKAAAHTVWREGTGFTDPAERVTYLGVERPEGLPGGSAVYTLANLASLIPE